VRALRFAAAFILVTVVAGTTAFAKDVPPPPTQWFTDQAGLVSASDAAALNDKLRNFEQSSGAQFIIYVFRSLEGDPLEDFTIRCAQKWKVGNKKYDNGLILFVFVQDRKFRIEVGYGLEGSVTDAISSRVERNILTPHFQKGDYAGGLSSAADYLITTIQHGEPAHEPVNPQSRSSSGSGHITGDPMAFPLSCGFLLFLLFALLILPRFFLPRRGSGCGGCFWPMFLLGGGGRGITFGGGGGGWGGGGGGFSGGGGGFGGGGASGGW
jgi:uncharacterized protein